MALFDIIMLVVIAGAVLFGWWKGLAWQAASVASVILSYVVAVNFRQPVSQFITAEEPWNRIAAMLILFLGTSLIVWTIYGSLSKTIQKMELKGFDRQAGALLGAVKGVLLCMVITMFSVSLLGEKAHDAIHNSRSGQYVVNGISQVSAIIPAELAQYIAPHVEDFEKNIGHPIDQTPDQPLFNLDQLQQTVQDPNLVPNYQYQGQWQTPTTPAQGYGNQNQNQQTGYQQQNGSQQYGTQQQYGSQQQYHQQQQNNNQQQYGNQQYQNQQYQTQQPNSQQQQYGSQQNSSYKNPNSYQQQNGNWQQQQANTQIGQGAVNTNTATNNGWPDFNSKDVFEAGSAAAIEAARKAALRILENNQQQR